MIRKALICVFLISGLLIPSLMAKNVDLVTLPSRDSVQLTIYNSEDITLVKETRYITFKRGANRIQFSWHGTLIDPTSVEFRALEHADEIEVADTTFPGQKPSHLFWNIASEYEGQAKVEVTYFTSGISWSMDYVATTNPGETKMQFDGYVRVYNRSGEEYENAEVRLIVGTINLVEKIANLAKRRGMPVPQLEDAGRMYKDMRKNELRRSFKSAGKYKKRPSAAAPKKIVKEGLVEQMEGSSGLEIHKAALKQVAAMWKEKK